MKIQKKKMEGGGPGASGWGGGGQGGCERRIEVFCENSKNMGGGGSGKRGAVGLRGPGWMRSKK